MKWLLGVGTAKLQFTYGMIFVLTIVYHVFGIETNLIYTNLLGKKGVKTVSEFDKLILSKNDIGLLGRVTQVMKRSN